MDVRKWVTDSYSALRGLDLRKKAVKVAGVGGVLALVIGLGVGVLYVRRGVPKWWSRASGPTTYTTTQIPINDSEIINPLRGYFRWRGTEVVDREVVPSQDEYERYVWRDLETSPGVYDFSIIDKAIATAASRGQKYWLSIRALRGDGGYYAGTNVPDYMEPYGWWNDSNGNGSIDKTTDSFIPDWNHQYFLERATALINALGQKYDKDPRVSMIEIRIYGLYGEWHMSGIDYNKAPVKDSAYCSQSVCVNQRPIKPDGSTANSPGAATLRKIIDMHVSAFPNKQLAILVGGQETADAIQYALSRTQTTNPPVSSPIGLRHDCLGLIEYGGTGLYYEHFRDMSSSGQWQGQVPYPQWVSNTYTNNAPESLGQNRWKYAPMIAEYCSMFPGMKETKNGTNKPIFQVAQQQVLDYHVALVGNGNFEAPFSGFSAQEQADAILVGKLAGYRIVLNSLSVPATLTPGQQFLVTTKWVNVGVAPVYESWNITFQMRSGSNVVWQGASTFKLQGVLPTGPDAVTVDDTYLLPANISNGVYSVTVVVQDPNGVRKPLALAISGRAADGSYTLGPVTVSESTPAPTASTTPLPTPTISPAPTPTLLPTPTPSPAPTLAPTPTPTVRPTPTPTPRPTSTPTPTPLAPTPTPTPVPTSVVRYSGVMADAFVSKGSRDTNYGTSPILEIDGDPVKIVYLKFDLRSVTGTPKSVMLRYKVANAADAGSGSRQNVKFVNNTSWSETGITYRNRPAANWWPMATINGGGQNTWGSVDLTSGLKGKMGNYVSIAIDSSGSDGFRLDSRESPTTEKPYLEMVF